MVVGAPGSSSTLLWPSAHIRGDASSHLGLLTVCRRWSVQGNPPELSSSSIANPAVEAVPFCAIGRMTRPRISNGSFSPGAPSRLPLVFQHLVSAVSPLSQMRYLLRGLLV